jgi:hypothetical protein
MPQNRAQPRRVNLLPRQSAIGMEPVLGFWVMRPGSGISQCMQVVFYAFTSTALHGITAQLLYGPLHDGPKRVRPKEAEIDRNPGPRLVSLPPLGGLHQSPFLFKGCKSEAHGLLATCS